MCIYNIYIYIHIHLCIYIYIHTNTEVTTCGPVEGQYPWTSRSFPMQSLFGSTLSVPWVKHKKLLNLSTDLHTFDGSMSGSSCEQKSMCQYVQTRLTQSDTIYLIWYQAASRSSLVLCFCVPSPPIPRGTVIASKPISPSHQIWPVQQRVPETHGVAKLWCWTSKNRHLAPQKKFSVAKICCDPCSTWPIWDAQSSQLFLLLMFFHAVYIYIWLIVIVQAIFGFGLTCGYIFLLRMFVLWAYSQQKRLTKFIKTAIAVKG